MPERCDHRYYQYIFVNKQTYIHNYRNAYASAIINLLSVCTFNRIINRSSLCGQNYIICCNLFIKASVKILIGVAQIDQTFNL